MCTAFECSFFCLKMRKTLSLLVLLITLFSCSEKIEVTSFDFVPVIQTTSGSVTNVQQPLSLSLKVSGLDESTDGNLDITFTVKNGVGNLITEEKTLEMGEKFSYNFLENPVAKLKYVPKNSGKHTVSFTLSNAKVNKSVSFDVDVSDMVINLSPVNVPQIPMVEKRFSFDLLLSGENLAELGECTLKASISKGSGDIYKEDVLISGSGKTGVLKEGRNVISYYAKEAGENILKFDIASQYGYTQELLVPIDIQKPEFTVLSSIEVDSMPVAPAAQDFSFKLKLTDDYEHGGMTFKGNYHFITNSGSVKVNGKTVASGADTEFKTGDNVISFNGSDAGIVEMEFIITNQYGVQKVERVKFDVGGGSISLEARQIHTEVDLLDSTPIELAIVRPGYSGKFELSATIIKGSGYILFNDSQNAISTAWITGLSNKEVIQFKPNKLEDVEFELTVRDSRGENVSEPILIKYKVNNPPIVINVKDFRQDIMINNQAIFSIGVSKKNYKGEFKYLVVQNPSETGVVLIDGNKTRPTLSILNNPLNTVVQFTPTTYPVNGEVKLNFTFTDEYNTIKDTAIIFNVQTPPINVWFDADRKEYPIGESVSFINRITQQGSESASFDISLKSRNTPIVTWNGTRFNSVTTLKAANGQENEVKLQAVAKGENPITFVITDQYGKSIEKEIVVVGKGVNDVYFNDFSNSNLIPNPAEGSVSVKSNDPDNKFFISYSIKSGSGSMMVGNNILGENILLEMHRGSSEVTIPLKLYPTDYNQDIQLELNIIDAYGVKKTKTHNIAFTSQIKISQQTVYSSSNAKIAVKLNSNFPMKSDKNIVMNISQWVRSANGTSGRRVYKEVNILFPAGATETLRYFEPLSTVGTNEKGDFIRIDNPIESDGTTYIY